MPLICLAKSCGSLATQRIPTRFAHKIITLGSIGAKECVIICGANLSARAFTTRYISLYLKLFKDYFLSLLNLENSVIFLLCIGSHLFRMYHLLPRQPKGSNTFYQLIYYNPGPYNSMYSNRVLCQQRTSLFRRRVES